MDHTYVNPELSLFSYEVLGLVGPNGAGAHDLLRMARHGRILDWAGESQYYVEPKRLAKLGYLAARAEPGKTRPRTVYTLTDRGRQALSEWARSPVRFTPVKSELLLRLLIADLVGEAATRESIATIRDDISDLSARLGESDQLRIDGPARHWLCDEELAECRDRKRPACVAMYVEVRAVDDRGVEDAAVRGAGQAATAIAGGRTLFPLGIAGHSAHLRIIKAVR